MDIKRGIDTLIIHCAATPNGRPHSIEEIDLWHRERGFARKLVHVAVHRPDLANVGYHYVIPLDGTTEEGRSLAEVGAHAAGHNLRSIGVCLIGTDQFTPVQWGALRSLAHALRIHIPHLRIIGHRDVNPGKTCPGFDVADWLAGGMQPMDGHVL